MIMVVRSGEAVVGGCLVLVCVVQVVQLYALTGYAFPYLDGTIPAYMNYHSYVSLLLFAASMYNLFRYVFEVFSSKALRDASQPLESAAYEQEISVTYLVRLVSQTFTGTICKPFTMRHLVRWCIYGLLFSVTTAGFASTAYISKEIARDDVSFQTLVMVFTPFGVFFSSPSWLCTYVLVVIKIAILQAFGCGSGLVYHMYCILRGGKSSLPDSASRRIASITYLHEVFGKYAVYTWFLPFAPDKKVRTEELATEAKWM